MKGFRLAKKIVGTLVKDRIQYSGRLIADTLSFTARCGFLLVIYWYVFRLKGGAMNGTTYAVVAWSMFFYFAVMILNARSIARMIMQDVQSGNVELLLNRPVSYLWYRVWWQLGSGLYPFAVISILGSVVLFFVVGIPSTMTIGIFLPTLVLTLIGSITLSLIVYGLVGLLAFWIEEVNPIYWLVDRSVMILGGSYLPVALFPAFLYKIAIYSPFGASQFISHTVNGAWVSEWPILLGFQAIWIVVLGIVMCVTFASARKKVSVNGG